MGSPLSYLRQQLELQKTLQTFIEELKPEESLKLLSVTPDRILHAIQSGASTARPADDLPFGYWDTERAKKQRAKARQEAARAQRPESANTQVRLTRRCLLAVCFPLLNE